MAEKAGKRPARKKAAAEPKIAEPAVDSDGRLEAAEEQPPTEKKPAPARHKERLQKIIAAAGIPSRRKAEELILAGRVQVNGQTVIELGSKADAALDHIRVDGKLLA